MRYTVTWTKSADGDLAEVWIASADRGAVSAAASEVDRVLRDDPERKGIEICEGLRAINLPPLRFLFSVRRDDRIVEIAVVREI